MFEQVHLSRQHVDRIHYAMLSINVKYHPLIPVMGLFARYLVYVSSMFLGCLYADSAPCIKNIVLTSRKCNMLTTIFILRLKCDSLIQRQKAS